MMRDAWAQVAEGYAARIRAAAHDCGICGRSTADFPSTSRSFADGSVHDVCDVCSERGDESDSRGVEDEGYGGR